ncbi:MAG TPA: carboxypeptidase-like regulatory domain-containing protein, partial [Vicinamibacteria bacterium]
LVFENDGQTWQASSDEEGQYQAALGPAGEYRITVAARGDSAEASFHRRFHAGEQAADFALDVGAIVVRVVREDAAPLQEDVHLALISKGARRSGAWRPDPQREKRFSGLPAGEYWVTARTASGLVALSPGRALLTAEQPQAEVELALGRHDGVLEVVDESGGPLPAAQVEARETLLAPAGPGTFSLREVPMGDWLKVRAPGYLPACRIVQPGDLPAMRVPLRRAAEAVTLSLAPELGWDAGLWQMPGSDCPVAMSELEYEARPERSGTTVVVRLPRGRYQLAVGALTQAVEAPGGEVHFGAPR